MILVGNPPFVACQHSLDNQTKQLLAGAGEDILLSGPNGVARECQEEEV